MNITVDILQFCTQAAQQPDRTLNVTGITDHLRSPVFPCVVGNFSILFRFRWTGTRNDVGRLEFSIVYPDGSTTWKQSGRIDASMEDHIPSAAANMIMKGQWKFDRPGTHELRVYWNGEEIASTPLNLEHVPNT